MQLTTSETPIVHPDDLNRPRCDLLTGGDPDRCLAQGSGEWVIGSTSPRKRIVLCEDHRLSLEEQMRSHPLEDWVPFLPSETRVRIAYMLERVAAGVFG